MYRAAQVDGKTYFGVASLVTSIVSILFLGGSFLITVMNITPAMFSRLNTLTYSVYCLTTPFAFFLGAFSFTRKNDFTVLSLIGMGMVTLPFLFFTIQLISFFLQP